MKKAKQCNNAVTHRNDKGLTLDIDIDLHMIQRIIIEEKSIDIPQEYRDTYLSLLMLPLRNLIILFVLPNSTLNYQTHTQPIYFLPNAKLVTVHLKMSRIALCVYSVSVSKLITKTFSLQFCKLNPKYSKISGFRVLALKNYSLGLNPRTPE